MENQYSKGKRKNNDNRRRRGGDSSNEASSFSSRSIDLTRNSTGSSRPFITEESPLYTLANADWRSSSRARQEIRPDQDGNNRAIQEISLRETHEVWLSPEDHNLFKSTSIYPVLDLAKNQIYEHPVAKGENPSLSYAFCDFHDSEGNCPLYFTNDPSDPRYLDKSRYIPIPEQTGDPDVVRLLSKQEALDYLRNKKMRTYDLAETQQFNHYMSSLDLSSNISPDNPLSSHFSAEIRPNEHLDATNTSDKFLDFNIAENYRPRVVYQGPLPDQITIGNSSYRRENVSGDGLNCAIRAALVSAGRDQDHPQFEQIVKYTRKYLIDSNLVHEDQMLDLGLASGRRMIAHLRQVFLPDRTPLLDPSRPIEVVTLDPHTGLPRSVLAVESQSDGEPLRVFLDEANEHFSGLVPTHEQVTPQRTLREELYIDTNQGYFHTTSYKSDYSDKTNLIDNTRSSEKEERVPWEDRDLEELVIRVKALKANDPKAKLTRVTDRYFLEKLRTHRFSPSEWEQVRSYMQYHKIKNTDAVYKYLRTYAQAPSTSRANIAAAKKGQTLSQYRKESKKRNATKKGQTLSQYTEESRRRTAESQGKTLSQYRRESRRRTAESQGQTLSQYVKESNERTAANQGKTLYQYRKEISEKFNKNIKDPEYRQGYLERQFQRRKKGYEIVLKAINDAFNQAKNPEEAKRLENERTTLQEKWKTFKKANQAEQEKLSGFLKTQKIFYEQLSNQQLDPLTLEHIQRQINDFEQRIDECINWHEENDFDYYLDHYILIHGTPDPNTDQFNHDSI